MSFFLSFLSYLYSIEYHFSPRLTMLRPLFRFSFLLPELTTPLLYTIMLFPLFSSLSCPPPPDLHHPPLGKIPHPIVWLERGIETKKSKWNRFKKSALRLQNPVLLLSSRILS
jgi:hypothetical protein